MIDKTHTTPAATVAIGDVKLPVLELQAQRVVTLAMVDKVHGRPEGTARKRFNDHKSRFIEGEDYFVRNTDEAQKLGFTAPNGLILMTETGYLMLVKSFQDNLAWEVQRKLVTSYFRNRGNQPGLTAAQHGGITKAVVTKALAEMRPAIVAEVAAIVLARGLPSGQLHTAVEYVPALTIIDDANVPQKGRGGLVRRASNALDRFCRREGIPVRSEAHTERRLFHVDVVPRWFEAEGKALVQRHMDRLAGQSVMQFPKKGLIKPVAMGETH